MDNHEDRYGVSWGHEMVPTTSGASNKEFLKNAKEFSSFHLDGTMYQVHDTVYVLASEGLPYIAKILTMYELIRQKEKCMSVRWFCRACELPTGVAGVNYMDSSKEIYMSWGNGSKNVVNPASTLRKCTVVCTAPLEWNVPPPTTKQIATADHSFSYAFHTKFLKVVSLNLVVNQFGEDYVRGSGPRSSHVSTTNGGSRRKTMEPGTKTAARVTPDQGNSQPAGKASAGPSLSTPPLQDGIQVIHKKARVDEPNRVEGSRPIRELIAEANKKKKLRVDPLGPNPEPGSLERPVVRDSSSTGLGERPKKVSSDPSIFKKSSVNRPTLIGLGERPKKVSSDPSIFERSSVNRPTLIGLGEILENVSSIYKTNETPKFAGKNLVETDLKRKRMQDSVSTPSPGFIKMPWHKALELALEKGKVLLLQNLDPRFSSCEIETMLTEVLSVSCEARMQPPKDFSCYTSGEALVLFQSRVEAEGALLKLTENVLIWSEDQRPVVASLATKQSHEVSPFHGFMNLAQFDRTNSESQRAGGATSHCSQPNTMAFEMGMQWRLLQEQHTKAWNLAAELSDSQPHLLGTEKKDLVHGFL